MFSLKEDTPSIVVFTSRLYVNSRIKISISYSTFGFAVVFDKNNIDIIFVNLLIFIKLRKTDDK